MRKHIKISFLILSIFITSCDKFLEPSPDGTLSEEQILNNPSFAEGLLMTAYSAIPNDYDFGTDVASDDAVTNDKSSIFKRMALGEWLPSFNPISEWSTAYHQISYINRFLEIYESVNWSSATNLTQEENELRNRLHIKRLKGEAFALRAWYQYKLLQSVSGKTPDGRMLGYPIINEVVKPSKDWEIPRNTFSECIENIFADLDTAIANLPPKWLDNGTSAENATMGARFENRINGNTARAIKSRVALLAASPAFAESNAVQWAEAASIAGDLLKDLGPLYSKGIVFYKEKKNAEIIWNLAEVQKRSWELENFPPSLFGFGRTNPSQNLIDAFPMGNGYPTNDPLSNFDPLNPYTGRDSRLKEYIIYNGAIFKSNPIMTYVGEPQNGINSLTTSTKTGYYLKKLLAEGVTLTSGSAINAAHTYTLVRMTEVLLNYAEAANEAWGPDGDPNGYGFTARSKIAELRARAGINPDNYLTSISSKENLRNLIHNERRIELCFEGFRFWDIRRWNDPELLTKSARGVYITKVSEDEYTFDYQPVEERNYQPFMIYGPIPYEETLKYDIQQNSGW